MVLQFVFIVVTLLANVFGIGGLSHKDLVSEALLEALLCTFCIFMELYTRPPLSDWFLSGLLITNTCSWYTKLDVSQSSFMALSALQAIMVFELHGSCMIAYVVSITVFATSLGKMSCFTAIALIPLGAWYTYREWAYAAQHEARAQVQKELAASERRKREAVEAAEQLRNRELAHAKARERMRIALQLAKSEMECPQTSPQTAMFHALQRLQQLWQILSGMDEQMVAWEQKDGVGRLLWLTPLQEHPQAEPVLSREMLHSSELRMPLHETSIERLSFKLKLPLKPGDRNISLEEARISIKVDYDEKKQQSLDSWIKADSWEDFNTWLEEQIGTSGNAATELLLGRPLQLNHPFNASMGLTVSQVQVRDMRMTPSLGDGADDCILMELGMQGVSEFKGAQCADAEDAALSEVASSCALPLNSWSLSDMRRQHERKDEDLRTFLDASLEPERLQSMLNAKLDKERMKYATPVPCPLIPFHCHAEDDPNDDAGSFALSQ
eukprot:TRINITY_DN24624_c0_g1_i1.p1 TRINITY_DN24624_c0_g1~~TRINITY_DN24624_c0_g1_i1.p1  ORF type:complete len:497 (-),score=108.61 TRINITY_DN24624_c0_g1_i1:33-1523(-)